jgi:hypothetical protein
MTWRAISINKEIYRKPLDSPGEVKKKSRMGISLFLPPSDVPQFVYPEYREKEDVFTINFKYTDEEKEKELFKQKNIRLVIGIYSGKPLRIEIRDIRRENINEIQLTRIIRDDVGNLIEQNIDKVKELREKSNLKCAKEVLKQTAGSLAAEAA